MQRREMTLRSRPLGCDPLRDAVVQLHRDVGIGGCGQPIAPMPTVPLGHSPKAIACSRGTSGRSPFDGSQTRGKRFSLIRVITAMQ